jgi:hypothetical protein
MKKIFIVYSVDKTICKTFKNIIDAMAYRKFIENEKGLTVNIVYAIV